MLLPRAVLWVALALLLVGPTRAQASGSFGSRYVDQNFSYTYREHVRKIFLDIEQSRRHFASKEQAFYQRLAAVLPDVNKVFARARRRKVPIARYSLTLPAVRLPRMQDVAQISRAAYPLNLIVERDVPRYTETLELSFSRAPRVHELRWLVSAVRRVLAMNVEEEEQASAPVTVQRTYPAVCKLTGTFGLYVGATVKTDLPTKNSLERAFSAELQRLLPAMGRKLADAGAMEALGVTGGLLPLEPLVGKRGLADPCQVFNPHGPLVDGAKPELVRTSHEKGSMTVIVLIAPRAYNWGKVNPTFHRWLKELLIDEHHRRARMEQSYLLIADRNGRQRLGHLSQMAQVREPRFQKLLSRIILDRREPESFREDAVRILAAFDPPRPYRTLVRLLATSRDPKQHDGALVAAVRALAAYPRRRVVQLLIRIRNNARAEWNTRTVCDDALTRIAGKLPDGHPLKKRITALDKL